MKSINLTLQYFKRNDKRLQQNLYFELLKNFCTSSIREGSFRES